MKSFVAAFLAVASVTLPWPVYARPYLSKPGEAPAKTLIAALEKVVKNPAVASKQGNLGMVADYVPPDKLIAEIRAEHRIVEQIAKRLD